MEANMAEGGDVRALLNKFNRQADSTDASTRRDSGPLKHPSPGLRTWAQSETPPNIPENERLNHKLMPIVTPQPVGAGAFQPRGTRMPMAEPRRRSTPRPQLPPLGVGFQRPPMLSPMTGKATPLALDTGRVRLREELLQNVMLNHVAGMPAPAQAPTPPPAQALMLHQQPASRGNIAEVTPLRRSLPPEVRQPVKPRRPQQVNLESYLRSHLPPLHQPVRPGLKKINGSPTMGGRSLPSPGTLLPPSLPRVSQKPLSQKVTMSNNNIQDTQDMYDDIDTLENSNSWDGSSSQNINRESDDSEVYESIEDSAEPIQAPPEPKPLKKQKKELEQDKKDKKEQQKRENELRKKFQLKGPLQVIHTAKVRCDWQGGRLDLAVRQGEEVEILRVNDNPSGKWLARSLSGKCGYVSIDCVNYEEVKRQAEQTAALPPPPPDPLQTREFSFDVDSSRRHADCMANDDDDDDYDDVQVQGDFPAPPEFSFDSKLARELKNKFKFEGPVRALHTVMVDPNGVIKRPKGKELAVAQGEILDVVQINDTKMALCQNHIGKFGYVPQSLLLAMEGDVYDDIDHFNDIYDNDTLH